MDLWNDVVAGALVGTERQESRLAEAGTPLRSVLARLAEREPEARLLAAAGLVSLYRRAGQLPEKDRGPTPEAAPPEELPLFGPRAAQHLEVMLGGRHKDALPEWLRAAGQAGKRVPETLLPDLLQAGRQDRSLRELILPVLGRRGRWLAAQNRDWAYSAADPDEEGAWETGARAARRVFLSRLRGTDPARARELLEGTWSQEPADDRAAFLEAFRSGLSLEDEPFLDAALDDRSKTVRQVAVDLLARLPGSRLGARMLERVRPLITFRTAGVLGIGRGVRVEATLPSACDREMVRDGVDAKLPPHERRFGERAWWLLQMVGAVPPSLWSETAACPAAELVAAAEKADGKTALLNGWSLAAERHRDPDWAEALLTAECVAQDRRDALVDVLPPERREVLVSRLMRGTGSLFGEALPAPAILHEDHPALRVLQQCDHPWSDDLSRTVLAALRYRIANPPKGRTYDWRLQQLLPSFALHVNPAMAGEAERDWPDQATQWQNWEQAVRDFTALLHFRRDMLEEIRK